MEAEEIQTRKFARIGNGRRERDDEGNGKLSIRTDVNCGAVADGDGGAANRLRGWHPHHASRIIRVSRASGGKDRHSKVWTSKGPRDRRVRLSVGTAIQFYDLQDRLGCDQPSKAVEWLIKAASDSIAELPSLNSSFPDTQKQLSDEKKASGIIDQAFDSVEADLDGDGDPDNFQQNQSQHLSLSKSACSSNSETSKNSGLSFSRSEIRANRDKARERARVRAAKEKEKEYQSRIPQNSFSELLGGTGSVGNNSSPPDANSEPNLFHKTAVTRHWSSTPMDYFETGGLLGPSLSRNHNFSVFSGQIQSLPQTMSISPYRENHNQELQHFSFVPDHIIPVAATTQGPGADYDLNFSISSGLSSFNRGTLQSNSPSFLPHLQRFDGSPFFIGTSPVENHQHQFPGGFDPRLQLFYGNNSRNLDQKGKGKN